MMTEMMTDVFTLTRHVAKLRTQVEGDSSLMTYTGHTILQTLIRYKMLNTAQILILHLIIIILILYHPRCHFSPAHTTGQSLIYTGCAAGRVVIYDLLTGEIVKVEEQNKCKLLGQKYELLTKLHKAY